MSMDEMRTNGMYYGIDIGEKSTLLSYYRRDMAEPVTVSSQMGSEMYQIPTFLAKKRGVGQWFFGNDAIRQVQLSMAVGVDGLLEKARNKEYVLIDTEEYPAEDLLLIFLKKLLLVQGRVSGIPIAKLVITVDVLDEVAIALFTVLATRMGLETDQLLLLDHRECFYYYALSQDPSLYLHDVLLYDYTQSHIRECLLKRNTSTRPQVINMYFRNLGAVNFNKDRSFDDSIRKTLSGGLISAVYLIGDGFDGDWMKQSLQRLCQGRRVFIGKNLYSKGACYAGMVRDGILEWPFVYIGDNDLKLNVSLKVIDHNEMGFVTLISAGDSWYDAHGECEVILDGTPQIECWIQGPESRKATVETIELKGLPTRENRTTRLRISAKPRSDKEVVLVVADLGFGELCASSGKSWEHVIKAG
ncbi:MAG: hypothetical protein IJ679_00255 [Lachnospiraceae bacterium]|nr:hypothetical protein [Lachnospiraceae bacterium]